MASLADKLSCLFGIHKFTEQWEVNDDTFNPMYMYICSVCRRYVSNQSFSSNYLRICEIIKETPEELWVSRMQDFYVIVYEKWPNNILTFKANKLK